MYRRQDKRNRVEDEFAVTLQGSWQWEPVVVCWEKQNEGWGPGVVRTSWGVRAGHGSQGPSHLPCQELGSWGTVGAAPALVIGLLSGDREGTKLRWDSHSLGVYMLHLQDSRVICVKMSLCLLACPGKVEHEHWPKAVLHQGMHGSCGAGCS